MKNGYTSQQAEEEYNKRKECQTFKKLELRRLNQCATNASLRSKPNKSSGCCWDCSRPRLHYDLYSS